MDWNKFLTSEAIATYVVFVLGALFGVVSFFVSRWIGRKRPRKILLVKSGESSLIKVAPNVKDDIVIRYRDKPVESLYLTSFTLRNNSDDVIDDVRIQIEFEDTDVIDVDVVDRILDRASSVTQKSESSLEIRLPFLNPGKLYKDGIRVNVIALRPIKVKSVSGGGREWAVEFFDQEKVLRELLDEVLTTPLTLSNPVALMKVTKKMFPIWLRILRS